MLVFALDDDDGDVFVVPLNSQYTHIHTHIKYMYFIVYMQTQTGFECIASKTISNVIEFCNNGTRVCLSFFTRIEYCQILK